MSSVLRPVRSWLYVPGHRPDRVAKALVSGADAVVIDLEDAVPPALKAQARATTLDVLSRRVPGPQVWVRVNAAETKWGQDDLAALVGSQVDGLRMPRAQDPELVADAARLTGLPLQLLLETALGLRRAPELAQAHSLVSGLGLGEADLSADLGLVDDAGLAWARGWLVVAARSSGLPSPVQSVWTNVSDLDGLRRSTEVGRAMGFVGRSVVHPRQLPVVHDVFTPSGAAVAIALAVLEAADHAALSGEVAVLDRDGRFIDAAVVARARVLLALAGHEAAVVAPAPNTRHITATPGESP